MYRLMRLALLVVLAATLAGCSSGQAGDAAPPVQHSKAESTAPGTGSVSDFFIAGATSSRPFVVDGLVATNKVRAGSRQIDLVDGQTTLTVSVPSSSAAQVAPGDTAEFEVTHQALGDALKATFVQVLEPAPYPDVLARIRSAGLAIEPDPGSNLIIGDTLGSGTAAYSLGDPPGLVLITTTKSRAQADSQISTLKGVSHSGTHIISTLYVFHDKDRLVGYFGSGQHGVDVVRQLTGIFGLPVEVPWIVR